MADKKIKEEGAGCMCENSIPAWPEDNSTQ